MKYYKGDKIKEDERDKTCTSWGRQEICKILVRIPEGRGPFGRPSVDMKIIFKLIL